MKTRASATRRDFLKLAASTLAVPTIAARSFLRAEDKAPPSERIGIGFIGSGKIIRHHMDVLLPMKEVQALAVSDVDTTRREHGKKRIEDRYSKDGSFEGCGAYVDYAELLARKDIDAVVIGTPDHWHAAALIDAAKAAKDIYCEKPLTLTIEEAKLCIDAVRKHSRVMQTGSQQRSSQEFRVACELVRSGRIGKVQKVYAAVGGPSKWCDLPEETMEPGLEWDRWLGQAPKRPYSSVLSPRGVHDNFPAWRNYREYSGGGMTDWGAHHFDIAQWGLGMDDSGPVEIVPPEDPKATSGLRFVYENGVELVHGGPGGVVFVGTEGEIFVDRGRSSSKPDTILKQPLGEKDVHLYRSQGHQRDWLDCIRTRKDPICPVEVGARSVTVCHLGNIAYWEHRKLRWNPKAWRFVGDEEANRWIGREQRAPYELPKI